MRLTIRKNPLNNHILYSFPIFLLLWFPLTSAAENVSQQARQLINLMSQASRELNYDGTFVYRRGERMETMRLIHKADEKGEKERLVSLTGHAREVIRDKRSVTCIFPDNQSVMVEKSRPRKLLSSQLPEPIEKIAEHYKFSVTGMDRVAGRAAHIVNIVPKDAYRYGYQLWIDEESKLLLKSELKDNMGNPLEQILFAKIDVLSDIPDYLLKPEISGTGYTWYNNATDELPVHSGNGQWKVTWMPNGFFMSDHEKQSTMTNRMPVDHLVYTDGLAMVSVFVEKLSDEPEVMQGHSSLGGVNTFAILSDGYQITAVGEVPQETVQLMANSVIQSNQ